MENKSYEVKPLDRWNNVTDKKYRMNALLKTNLDILKNVVEYDSDMLILIDGEIEGVGKSTLAQQVGYYFAYKFGTKFDVDNIVFSPKQVEEAVTNAPPHTSIVWDESYEGANKYRIMSSENQRLIRIFQKIRQRNLILIMVLPSFFDLSKYFAIRRSWLLLHCYYKPQVNPKEMEHENIDFDKPILERGYFKYYTRPLKKKLYNMYKKTEDYSYVKPKFVGMFPADYCVDKDEYKLKKSKIEEEEGWSEKEYILESFRRKMPVKILKNYVSYAEGSLFNIQRNYKAGIGDDEGKE